MPRLALNKFLADVTAKRKISGCVCWVGNSREVFFNEAFGYAQIKPRKTKIDKDTLFDLVSITKPMCTALSIILLYEKKKIRLSDKVKRFLPEFKRNINGEKTVKQLLTHTSGIPAWYPIYLFDEKERMKFLAKANTGKRGVIYSCLGYIILGKIIEAVSGKSLDKYCNKTIFKKIGLKNTLFGPVKRKNVAATEFGNSYEKKMASAYGDVSHIKWRDYVIKGEVHDGNSFYGFKGVSGNAGLFSNVRDLVKLIRQYCLGEIVKPPAVKLMTKDYTGNPEKRGLGWVIDPYPRYLSHATFYHTGFTGTMLLVDPVSDIIIILLTNAVHPAVKVSTMPPIRRKVVEIVSRFVKQSRH